MSMLHYCLLVIAFALPLGVKPQESGSSSGSGEPTIPLTTLNSLSQVQRDNLVTVGFTGMTPEEFTQTDVVNTFQESTANAINGFLSNNQIAKRQALVAPEDVIVIDAMEINGVLMVVIVVGGQNSLSIINSAEMVSILETEGERIAQALESALGRPVNFVGVIGAPPTSNTVPTQVLSQTTIIGIAVVGVVSVALVAVVIAAVAIYKCGKKKTKTVEERGSVDYVEVPADDEHSFSSKWQPMKVNPMGDYEAIPNTFKTENPSENTHTEL